MFVMAIAIRRCLSTAVPMNTAIDHYNLKITRLIYNMNAQTARSEPIVLGETAGFTLDDLSVKMLREWAAQVEHQYNSNVEMQLIKRSALSGRSSVTACWGRCRTS